MKEENIDLKDNSQYSDDGVVCPYCGEIQDTEDRGDIYIGENITWTCEECGESFNIEPNCSWSWTTNKDCELNKLEHQWKSKDEDNKYIGEVNSRGKTYCICKICGLTEYIMRE